MDARLVSDHDLDAPRNHVLLLCAVDGLLSNALSARARTTDDIARRAGFTVDQAAALLGLLELEGLVVRRATGWVQGRIEAAARDEAGTSDARPGSGGAAGAHLGAHSSPPARPHERAQPATLW